MEKLAKNECPTILKTLDQKKERKERGRSLLIQVEGGDFAPNEMLG